MLVNTGHGAEPATAGAVQFTDQTTLGAQPDSIGRVLNIASGNDPPVIHHGRYTDLESRVWRISQVHHRSRLRVKFSPVNSSGMIMGRSHDRDVTSFCAEMPIRQRVGVS